MYEELNKRYGGQIVRQADGNYFKIKEVVGWNLSAALIMVDYTEGPKCRWVDISGERPCEA